MTKGWTALAILPPYLLYLLDLLHYLHYYIIARIYYISTPATISLCVNCLVYHFYITLLIPCISYLHALQHLSCLTVQRL
jgi:hypothetical protein